MENKASISFTKDAILDTGTSLTYLPPSTYTSLLRSFGNKCFDYEGLLLCECSSLSSISTYSPLYFTFQGGVQVKLLPENYMLYEDGICYRDLLREAMNMLYMGILF